MESESFAMTDDPDKTPDPAEALASIHQARADVHRKVAAGSWRYDVIYSAIIAGMIGSQVLDMPLSVLGVTFGVLAMALLYRGEADRLGVTVSGMTPPRARWVAVGLALVLVAMLMGVIVLKHLAPSSLVLALGAAAVSALAFVLSLAASRLWLRVYRRETGVGG